MTYSDYENSTYQGAPWEAYQFVCGLVSYYQTSGVTARTILGYTYIPEALEHSEIDQNDELSAGSIIVSMSPDNDVALLFQSGGLPAQPVSLVIYGGHDGWDGQVVQFVGVVASVKFTDGICELTCDPEQSALKRNIPALTYQSQCPRQLGSAGCSVDLDDYRTTATLSSVSGNTLASDAFGALPNGYLKGGWIEANNTKMAIMQHSGSEILLFCPMNLSAGDTVSAIPGCSGTESICTNRYHNLVNHAGFCRIPGINPFASSGIA